MNKHDLPDELSKLAERLSNAAKKGGALGAIAARVLASLGDSGKPKVKLD